MRFGSVCSGIEAASVAFEPLGWKAAFFSEIENFPSRVLAYHYPDVPNHGDMTKFKEWKTDEPIRLLCGGTPCQSFSIAGLRKGLDDVRGNLMLTFGEMAAKLRPQWFLWENVPGVLSSNKGADFGAFLGLVSGREIPVPRNGWGKSGIIPGYKNAYGLAYRVFDAQYFGVAQRRRRVFVVGYIGDWRPAAAVLLEQESLLGHPAPRRETGKGIAAFTPSSIGGYSEGVGTLRANGGDLGGGSETLVGRKWPADLAPTMNAHFGDKQGLEDQHVNQGCPMFVPVAQTLRGEGFDASEDGTGRQNLICVHGTQDPCTSKHLAFALQQNNGAENCIAFSAKDYGADATEELSPTLRAGNSDKSHANSGNWMAVTIPIHDKATRHQGGGDTRNNDGAGNGLGIGKENDPCPTMTSGDRHAVALTYPINTQVAMRHEALGRGTGFGIGDESDPSFTLQANHSHAVAFQQNQLGEVREGAVSGTLNTNSNASGRNTPMALTGMAVRRLTPVECERLQGFRDDYTNVPDIKGKPAADGPRYKALGNSWAVPNVAWIGRRIDKIDQILRGVE